MSRLRGWNSLSNAMRGLNGLGEERVVRCKCYHDSGYSLPINEILVSCFLAAGGLTAFGPETQIPAAKQPFIKQAAAALLLCLMLWYHMCLLLTSSGSAHWNENRRQTTVELRQTIIARVIITAIVVGLKPAGWSVWNLCLKHCQMDCYVW